MADINMENDEVKLLAYLTLLKTGNLLNNMENCIDFALQLLDKKIETENIYILAGLNKNEYWEIKSYFEKILAEFNIAINIFDEQLAHKYVLSVANEVISGEKSAKEAVYELSSYCWKIFQHDNAVYNRYFNLCESIDLMEDNLIIIPGIENNDIEKYFQRHFQLVIEAKNIDIPQDIYEQAYCKKCKKRIKPQLSKELLGQYYYNQCPECKHNEFYWIENNDGMELYLKEKSL